MLTSTREKHLDGGVLQEVTSREDRPYLAEVPFPMQMLAVFQYLERNNTSFIL